MTWSQGTFRDIEGALRVLVGAPVIGSRRAADLEAFRFGRLMEATSPTGEHLEAEYGLHVQCPWRIVIENRIHVGHSDLAMPPSGTTSLDFDYKEAEFTRRDELINQYFASRAGDPRLVVACRNRLYLDVSIEFDDGSVLELFPDMSSGGDESEFWRLLLPDGGQFVVTGDGVERYAEVTRAAKRGGSPDTLGGSIHRAAETS